MLPPAAHASLSLAEALARTAERNPRLLADSAQTRAAAARVEQAGFAPNPVLGVTLENFAGTGTARGVDSLESTVEISQTLERGAKRTRRTALATREQAITTQELAVQRASLLAATAQAYVDTVVAEQRLALAAAPRQLARDTLDALTAHASAGAASSAEIARARAMLAVAEAEVARRETELTLARSALAAAWGGDATDVPPLDSDLHLPPTLPDRAAWLPRLSAHPRFALHAAQLDARRAALELEQAHAVQDVSVAGGVRFLRESSDAAFVAGVSVPLPIRHKNQGGIRAARELLAGTELAAAALETELRAEFTAAWHELTAAHEAVLRLRRDALPATEAALTAVRDAHTAGELPLTDVFDAQRALTLLRRDLLDQQAAFAHALVRLETLTHSDFSATTALFSAP